MSRLNHRIGALSLAGAFLAFELVTLAALPARAAEGNPPVRWDMGSRIGYADAWTTGQSYLGAGTGLAGGATFRVPIRVEVGGIYQLGSIVSAENRMLSFRSRQWSFMGHLGVGYDLAMFRKRFVVRPRVLLGGAFVSDSVELGGVARHELDPMFVVGPGIDLIVRFGKLHAGADGRAFFVPSRVAAPIAAAYGVFGVEL